MRFPWVVVGALILLLGAGVVALDQRQARRGEPSLLALPWRGAAPAASRPGPAPRPRAGGEARRIAVIVDELGSRADVFERVVALGRPVTVAVLPELPLSRRLANLLKGELRAVHRAGAGGCFVLELPMSAQS